jgi:hypothetical protein
VWELLAKHPAQVGKSDRAFLPSSVASWREKYANIWIGAGRFDWFSAYPAECYAGKKRGELI